jgi:hypothetical protein
MIGGYTHRLMGGFMKYATEMGSDAMIYMPSFIKTDSSIQNLMGEGGHTAW